MLSCEHDYWMICGSNRLTCLILSAGNLRRLLKSWTDLLLIISFYCGEGGGEGGGACTLTSLLSSICGQVGVESEQDKMWIACVWVASESRSKQSALRWYLIFMCRGCLCLWGVAAVLYTPTVKPSKEDMITRCYKSSASKSQQAKNTWRSVSE